MSTLELLHTVGYPTPEFDSHSIQESRELYRLARRNKIGSLYVKRLYDTGELDTLASEWENRKDFIDRKEQATRRICELIPSGVTYAIVKSYPFWVDSSDVDILLFQESTDDIMELIRNGQYDVSDYSPTTITATDLVTDIEIDFQIGFSLQELIYFDRETIRDGIKYQETDEIDTPFIPGPDDLALMTIHSISEQLFILKEFYGAIYYLESFDEEDFERFQKIVAENGLQYACGAFFSLVSTLSQQAFGTQPELLDRVLELYPPNHVEQQKLLDNDLTVPHRYSSRTISALFGGNSRTSASVPASTRNSSGD